MTCIVRSGGIELAAFALGHEQPSARDSSGAV